MNQIHNLWKKDLSPRTTGEKLAFQLLETTWRSPPEDADDSDRGDYITTLVGTKLRTSPPGGWHAMEIADDLAREAYKALAKKIDELLLDISAGVETSKGKL